MRGSRRSSNYLMICACLALVAMPVSVRPGGVPVGQAAQYPAQEQPKPQPKVAAAELKAAQKVENATDEQARLALAGEFLKKYPKSTLRMQVAQLVADKLGATADPTQLITLAENFRTLFPEPGEANLIDASLVHAYLSANRAADAFQFAAKTLAVMPNPVPSLIELANAGYVQVQQQNVQFVPQSIQYAGRAIELIEADKKPATVDDATWREYKITYLPQLYQVQGVLLVAGGDPATAQSKLTKAITLNPADAQNYGLLGNLRNEQYQDLVAKYKTAPAEQQPELFKQAQTLLDQIIDDYAHAVALAEGKPQLQPLHDQLWQDVQGYYKYRHNGSADGLKELIEKYKQPAAPKP